MHVTKLPKAEHLGFIVADMDKSRQEILCLYGQLPGLDFVYDFYPDRVFGPDGQEIPEKCQIRICMINWFNGIKLELLQPILGNTEHDRFVKELGGGIHHIAYYVREGFEDYCAFLLEQGAKVLFRSETEDERGYRRCCYLRCPQTRAVIEIAEPPRPHNLVNAGEH